jgi:hypothetical protein
MMRMATEGQFADLGAVCKSSDHAKTVMHRSSMYGFKDGKFELVHVKGNNKYVLPEGDFFLTYTCSVDDGHAKPAARTIKVRSQYTECNKKYNTQDTKSGLYTRLPDCTPRLSACPLGYSP